jgi:hypothetical protein
MPLKNKPTLKELARLYQGEFLSVAHNFAEEIISLWRPRLRGLTFYNTSNTLRRELLKRVAQMDVVYQLLTFQLEEGLIKKQKCTSQQTK